MELSHLIAQHTAKLAEHLLVPRVILQGHLGLNLSPQNSLNVNCSANTLSRLYMHATSLHFKHPQMQTFLVKQDYDHNSTLAGIPQTAVLHHAEV